MQKERRNIHRKHKKKAFLTKDLIFNLPLLCSFVNDFPLYK